MAKCCRTCCVITLALALAVALLVSLFTSRIQSAQETAEFFRLVKESGYPIEAHVATAADGVELTLFRLPREGGHPVLLQHGVLDSAWMWVISKEFAPAAFQLHDAGYDVWLGNNRGNCFSTAWNRFGRPSSSAAFWNFSFEEMGTLDVPAQISKIVAQTGKEQLSFVGHSQGTAQFFIAAQAPNVGELVHRHVDHFVALSPVAYIGNTNSMILPLVYSHADAIMRASPSTAEAAMDSDFIRDADHAFCILSYGRLCELGMAAVVGEGWMESPRSITAYFDHFPLGSSAKDLIHFAQLIRSKRFQRFDYDAANNILHYGSERPPEYNLSKLKVPTALFFGQYDAWVAPTDAELLLRQVKPAVVFQKVFPGFSHSTWQVGKMQAGYWVSDLLLQLQRRNASSPPTVLQAKKLRQPGWSVVAGPAAAVATALVVAAAALARRAASGSSEAKLEPLLRTDGDKF